MKRSIFKPIVFGILFGAAAFFAPFFLIKIVLFMMFMSFIFRMFWWRSGGWQRGMQFKSIYADKIRNMSEEEYTQFKNKFSHGYRGHHHHHGCHHYSNWEDCKTETKDKEQSSENK